MTKRFALVFPGQGSQSVGMLSEWAQAFPTVKYTFDEASSVLSVDLWRLSQEGPEDELNRTERTQPAMLAAGIALWRVWQEQHGGDPVVMAGHSLGEYTALTAASCLDFKAALRLVESRGKLMQQAVPEGTGAMAAILGLSDEDVRAACAQARQADVVEAVNYNAPGQVVIAGHRVAVERAVAAAKASGAKRAIVLPVSVPSHCALMQEAATALHARLQEVDIFAPQIPVVNNAQVSVETEPQAIRQALTKQLYNPVRWVESVAHIAEQGVNLFIECGPGKVLSGLNKRIAKEAEHLSLDSPAALQRALQAATE